MGASVSYYWPHAPVPLTCVACGANDLSQDEHHECPIVVVISGNMGETEDFRRAVGLPARRVLHAGGPKSLARLPRTFNVVRVGTWQDRPDLRKIEATVAWRLAKTRREAGGGR